MDLATGPTVEAAAVAALQHGAPVQVDLTGVGFIDSIGIQALMVIHRSAKTAGVALTLLVSAEIRRVMEIMGLDPMLV
jgi:anti-anti-sigma factor